MLAYLKRNSLGAAFVEALLEKKTKSTSCKGVCICIQEARTNAGESSSDRLYYVICCLTWLSKMNEFCYRKHYLSSNAAACENKGKEILKMHPRAFFEGWQSHLKHPLREACNSVLAQCEAARQYVKEARDD